MTGRLAAIWQLGFRPFFLLGLLAACGSMAAWLHYFLGGKGEGLFLEPTLWHAHEMIFGFTVAIIVGFVATASQSWSGKAGITGWRLVLMAILWALGRVAMLSPPIPRTAIAILDFSFLPLATAFLMPYLGGKGQRRNLVILLLLAVLTGGNLLMHLGALGIWPGNERRGLNLSLHAVVLMIVVIGGRVLPFFTSRAVTDYDLPSKRVDPYAAASVALYAIVVFAEADGRVTATLAVVAAAVTFWQWSRWLDRRIWRVPVLWILYVGYAWVWMGFMLTALSSLGPSLTPATTATHAFTVGAIGTMIVGMVSRVSLGHTGRPIEPTRMVVVTYYLVTMAASIRVFGPMVVQARYLEAVALSGGLWIVAFATMFAAYLGILSSARPDGRPG